MVLPTASIICIMFFLLVVDYTLDWRISSMFSRPHCLGLLQVFVAETRDCVSFWTSLMDIMDGDWMSNV